jgi:hypothetical protein
MSGVGVDQGVEAPSAAVPRSTGEPGKARPIRRGGCIAKQIRRRELGKIVAVWSRITQSAWAACVRCGELSGAKVILSSLSATRMSPAVANNSGYISICLIAETLCRSTAPHSRRDAGLRRKEYVHEAATDRDAVY